MNKIDLPELSKRESERVEWKENVADIEDVVKTAVAFANDYSNLGGGYIICGARETKDEHGFQKLEQTGLTSIRFKEVENRVLAELRDKVFPPIIAVIEEIPVSDDRRILAFIIPATGNAHNYRASGKDSSTYYIRIGRETREARNGILRELLVKKNQIEPWDRRINQSATIDDIDLLSLREYLKEMSLWDNNKPLEDYLSPTERLSVFVPPLTGKEALTENLKPRNFSLLLFSKDPLKFFQGAYTVVSIYKGFDRSEPTAERHQLIGSVVEQAKKAIQILNTETYTAFDKKDNLPNQLKYPIRALQEAVINSIVHRDYEIDQPTRITVFTDRIEIYSPGSLPRAINKDKFVEGKATPFWRNQSLAYFFNKLQLAQAEGQGIPTILRTMKEEGCPDPKFEIEEESVTCILPAHPRHTLIKNLHEIENDIIIGKHDIALKRIEDILKQDEYNFRAIDLLCEISNIKNNPNLVLNFLSSSKIELSKLNPSTLINIAEVISHIKDNPKVSEIATIISKHAASASLEEREIEKAVIALKKLHQNEEVIDYVKRIFVEKPTLSTNIILLQNRARATMDMAKICIDTGKSKDSSKMIQAKAWNRARVYLDDAERDLMKALDNVTGLVEKDYLMRDLDFLNRMKRMAQRPRKY
jgi:ATP-dependent DNA helicase RecG